MFLSSLIRANVRIRNGLIKEVLFFEFSFIVFAFTFVFVSILRSRRSMDRTQLCGSCDAGSIPAGITKREFKETELLQSLSLCDGRSDVLPVGKTERGGLREF